MTAFTAVDRGPETDALINAISGAGVNVGDHIRPGGAGFPGGDTTQPFQPYAVLYQGVTLDVDGPVSDPFADTVNEYQVTSVGISRSSASVIADKVKHALLAGLAIPGRRVQLVKWERGNPAERDDDVTPPLFYVIDQYSIATSPV